MGGKGKEVCNCKERVKLRVHYIRKATYVCDVASKYIKILYRKWGGILHYKILKVVKPTSLLLRVVGNDFPGGTAFEVTEFNDK